MRGKARVWREGEGEGVAWGGRRGCGVRVDASSGYHVWCSPRA